MVCVNIICYAWCKVASGEAYPVTTTVYLQPLVSTLSRAAVKSSVRANPGSIGQVFTEPSYSPCPLHEGWIWRHALQSAIFIDTDQPYSSLVYRRLAFMGTFHCYLSDPFVRHRQTEAICTEIRVLEKSTGCTCTAAWQRSVFQLRYSLPS